MTTTTRDRLRDLRIINTHDLLLFFGRSGVDDVAVFYYPSESRMGTPARASVYSPSHKTDPNASWYDYGRKTFVGLKKKSVPEAIAWASKRYNITAWGVCPTNPSTRIPLHLRNAALTLVRSK